MLNCFGNETDTGCAVYSGPDIPLLGVTSGDSLNDVLVKIANASTASPAEQSSITSDDITSKSLIRNPGSMVSSKIVKRDFSYSITSGTTGLTFGWDMVPIIDALPDGYEAATVRVKASGMSGTSGVNLVADSRSPSSSLLITTDKLPVTVDVLVRVTAPGGNIDLETSIFLSGLTSSGTSRAILDANELAVGNTENISLTDQLNSIEAQVQSLGSKVDTLKSINVQGSDTDLHSEILTQKSELDQLKTQVDAPTNFEIDYTNDANETDGLGDIITDLYNEVAALRAENASLRADVSSLKSSVNSLNALT